MRAPLRALSVLTHAPQHNGRMRGPKFKYTDFPMVRELNIRFRHLNLSSTTIWGVLLPQLRRITPPSAVSIGQVLQASLHSAPVTSRSFSLTTPLSRA